jgi:hypothetical protein
VATAIKWSNVNVAMQSALGANKTITAITKANPGVVTSTSHGLSNGAYVVLTVEGMYQVTSRVFRIANVTTNTWELEGENTTSYDTFTSGYANEITFGTVMATATGLSASGGDFDFIDITTIHDNVRKQIPGLAAPAVYSFENIWDPSDTALVAMKSAADNQALRAIRFTFADGKKVLFTGYIGATLLPVGNAQDKVTTPVAITMFGRPTLYSS